MDRQIKIERIWRNELERAVILAGRSQAAEYVEECFLWNMIALEMLLTHRGDKYSKELPKRAKALLGWVGFWNIDEYESKISEIYKKRSALVHSGCYKNITIDDVKYSDLLLFNLLINIVGHIKIFQSKKDIIDFSAKFEAEQLLGIKPSVRPKTFRFLSGLL